MSAVNKYPIIRAYQIFLRCPECGANMKCNTPPWDVEDGKVTFNYICPCCQSKAQSGIQYPHQQFEFDLNNSTIEEELKS